MFLRCLWRVEEVVRINEGMRVGYGVGWGIFYILDLGDGERRVDKVREILLLFGGLNVNKIFLIWILVFGGVVDLMFLSFKCKEYMFREESFFVDLEEVNYEYYGSFWFRK